MYFPVDTLMQAVDYYFFFTFTSSPLGGSVVPDQCLDVLKILQLQVIIQVVSHRFKRYLSSSSSTSSSSSSSL